MIESREYKDWSAQFHADHAQDPIVMQMEITYRCPIHCLHCYADCYNNREYAEKELSTDEIKSIMDKLYNAGCVWFTLTGGDPMARKDFVELYDYAKKKGFILSVMTSLGSLTDEILHKMIQEPPFSIEMTLNGVTRETYEKISQVKGSFDLVMENIDKIIKAGLPIKIKTLVSENNKHEKDKIKEFVESKGLNFSPSTMIFARLNGDASPCQYRLNIDEVVKGEYPEDECDNGIDETPSTVEKDPQPNRFYRCAIGNWQWHIDPTGKLNICSCVREPNFDILNKDVKEGTKFLSEYVKGRRFTTDSECVQCKVWHLCHSCPGKAKLEHGNEEKPVKYLCELAKKNAKRMHKLNKINQR